MDDRGHWKAHGRNEALLTSSLVREYCVPENGELRATPYIGAFHDNRGHRLDCSHPVSFESCKTGEFPESDPLCHLGGSFSGRLVPAIRLMGLTAVDVTDAG